MNSNNDLLKMALSRMEGTFSPVTLSAWFDDAEAISLDGTRFVLRAANQFKKEIIESRFTGPLEQSLTELLGEPITLSVIYGELSMSPEKTGESIGLSPDEEYTFEHFIVGSSNKFAHAAAISVAITPQKTTTHSSFMGNPVLGKRSFARNRKPHILAELTPNSALFMSKARTLPMN